MINTDIFQAVKIWAVKTYGRFYVTSNSLSLTIMSGSRCKIPHDCSIKFCEHGVIIRNHLTRIESDVILFSNPDFFNIIVAEVAELSDGPVSS